MKSRYSNKELEKWDLIIAIFNNYADVGFYLGKGVNLSRQYYSIYTLAHWLDRKLDGKTSRGPYKSYMSNGCFARFIKYSSELIDDPETIETYNKAVEALKLLNI